MGHAPAHPHQAQPHQTRAHALPGIHNSPGSAWPGHAMPVQQTPFQPLPPQQTQGQQWPAQPGPNAAFPQHAVHDASAGALQTVGPLSNHFAASGPSSTGSPGTDLESMLAELTRKALDKLERGEDDHNENTGNPTRFSVIFKEFFQRGVDEGRFKPEHRISTNSSLRIFLEVCGDKGIGGYNRQDIVRFRSIIQKLPKRYWRGPKERETPILNVIAEAVAREEKTGQPYARVSNKTVNKHMSNICPVFAWAQKEGYISDNKRPFWTGLGLMTGFKVTGLSEREERPAYSWEQIEKIFQHYVWTGRSTEKVYNKPGYLIIRDSLYWAPLIAIFSLMRREEIAQLQVRHIHEIDGIWVFDLNLDGLRLKRPASKRYVPVHRCLIELGFIDTMVKGRNPDEQLFVELKKSAGHNTYGEMLGNRFARVLDKQGIIVMRKDGKASEGAFHPMRHFGETQLSNALVPGGVIDAIAGHVSEARDAQRDKAQRESPERRRYNDGYYVSILKEAIDKIEAPIDVQKLVTLANKYKPRKRRMREVGNGET